MVCRAIRRGALPLVKRRGRAVVPVAAVTRLLCHARARDARHAGGGDGLRGNAMGSQRAAVRHERPR